MFACEHFGVEPDILCLAKAMAGGFPMGAVLCSDKARGSGGAPTASTFGGKPLAWARVARAIDAMVEDTWRGAAGKEPTVDV